MKLKSKFPSYMEITPKIPLWIWTTARFITFVSTLSVCYFLLFYSKYGMIFFWNFIVALLPLIFFFAPGFWRNICPFAASNQVPKVYKFTQGLTLSKRLANYAFLIGFVTFLICISLRKVIPLDHQGPFIASGILSFIVIAFIGGCFFKGKSGWCASICPLSPIQQVYGQTAFIPIRNSHCRPCVGCTKNCYDFNPRISNISNLNSNDEPITDYRKFFVAILPGFILAFFILPNYPASTLIRLYAGILLFMSVSLSIFVAIKTFSRMSISKIAVLFGAAAINIYYWFMFRQVIITYNKIFNFNIPANLPLILSVTFFIVTLIWVVRSFIKENEFFIELESTKATLADVKSLVKANRAKSNGITVTAMPSKRTFSVKPGESLLEILERNDLPIEAGCRMGMCGADPVTIIAGQENLTPPKENECETLARLGLDKNCRMACSARVVGNVTLSLVANKNLTLQETTQPFVDKNIKDIVIIGNGAAGMTASEYIKLYHPECHVTVIGREVYHYYNRMALTRVIYGRSAMIGLFLLPSDWYKSPKIEVWLNTNVIKIDRENKVVILGSQEQIHYDKLIVATGAKAFIPPISNADLDGIFVLREATDALKIRSFTQEFQSRTAIVAGGGLLGLESAYALKKLNLHVTVIERAAQLLPRQLDQEASSYLQKFLEQSGIQIILNSEIEGAIGETYIKGVSLKNNKTINCDILLVSAGIKPNLELAKSAGLETGNGIIVNDQLQTSDPNIYAIGDVAQYKGGIEGMWVPAMKQAVVAATNAIGGHESYQGTSPNASLKIAGINVASMGIITPRNSDDRVIITHDEETHRYRKLVITQNIIIGAILIDYAQETPIIEEAIAKKINISKYIESFERGNPIISLR